MKIVVLDGYTLNPGDQSWASLESLGECRVYERTLPEQVEERARGAAIILTNKVPLTRNVLATLQDLRYIGVTATGYNIVDVTAARERGIPVTNVPTYGTRSVAQLTFALILELAHHVGDHAMAVRSGAWSRCSDFSFWNSPLVELEGLTLGIVGLGRIGRAVADVARVFGLRILTAGRSEMRNLPEDIQGVSMERLLQDSDIITLHCPLTDQTRHLINRERLRQVKPTAWLINTSRGALVDEAALAEALNEGRIGAAAVDVLNTEPPPSNNPLIQAKNCLVTPHLAWATLAARRRLLQVAVENVRAFLNNAPTHVVNP